MISKSLSDLNIMRREAIVNYLINKFFVSMGFNLCGDTPIKDRYRVNICDDSPLMISFDLEYASDFREDAYTWCFVDFFIKKEGIDIPDDLKTSFTRYIDTKSKRIFWRHREMVRIIDMDRAVDYILRLRNELLELLDQYGVESSPP